MSIFKKKEQQNKVFDVFINLVLSDDTLTKEEKEYIDILAVKYSQEVDYKKKVGDYDFNELEKSDKVKLLIEFSNLILIDGVVSDEEIDVFIKVIKKMGVKKCYCFVVARKIIEMVQKKEDFVSVLEKIGLYL